MRVLFTIATVLLVSCEASPPSSGAPRPGESAQATIDAHDVGPVGLHAALAAGDVIVTDLARQRRILRNRSQ